LEKKERWKRCAVRLFFAGIFEIRGYLRE
jgi:hypothetical protein